MPDKRLKDQVSSNEAIEVNVRTAGLQTLKKVSIGAKSAIETYCDVRLYLTHQE